MPLSSVATAAVTSAAASAAITCNTAGFLPGQKVIAVIGGTNGAAFSGTAVVQTSDDGTTWGTADGAVALVTTTGAPTIQEITLKSYVRLNVSAFTSGSAQARFISALG